MKTKKVLMFFLSFVLCFSLSSCGKSEEVKAVEERISAIGDVDENSWNKIESAETLYNGLTEKEQKEVENYSLLQDAKAEYEELLIANVELLIEAVHYDGDEPTEQLYADIQAAQQALDSLTAELQSRVRNYADLENVNKAISQYYITQAQNAINEAIEINANYEAADLLYNELTPEQQLMIDNYDTFQEKYEAYINTPPITLTGYTLSVSWLGLPEISISGINTSEKIIKSFYGNLYAFDNDNLPVSISIDFMPTNGISYSNIIKPDSSFRTYGSEFVFDAQDSSRWPSQYVYVLKDVTFFDETTWNNPQFEALCNNYENQFLDADDPNIIEKK